MKAKFLRLGVLAAGAMLLLSSCDKKEDGLEINNASPIEFIASMPSTGIDAVDTKTTTLDGTRVLWCNSDHISIFRGRNVNEEYKVKDGFSGKTTTTFVKANDDEFSGGSGDPFEANIAYYPYSNIDYVGSNGSHALSVNIPSTQTYAKGSFGEGSLPMVAVTSSKSDNALNFKNVFGFLKLQLKSADEIVSIKQIIIKGNNDEKLSGTATINCSAEGMPTIEFGENAGNSITLECNNTAINATTATDFWIALSPVTFSKGITVEIVTSAAPIEKKTSAPLTITRSKVKPMEVLTVKVDMEEELNIPDANFKKYLLENFDVNSDGKLTLYDAIEWNKPTYPNKRINIPNKDISSLKGIEYFTELKYLDCSLNPIKSLNLSNHTALKTLFCGKDLTDIDLSGCIALTYLSCSSNPNLSYINLNGCTALTELYCTYCNLTTINLSDCTALKKLLCFNNQLTELDLNNCASLQELHCGNNQLTELNLSNNIVLTNLQCNYNQLTTLNLLKNTAWTELSCVKNPITSIYITKGTKVDINCEKNVNIVWVD